MKEVTWLRMDKSQWRQVSSRNNKTEKPQEEAPRQLTYSEEKKLAVVPVKCLKWIDYLQETDTNRISKLIFSVCIRFSFVFIIRSVCVCVRLATISLPVWAFITCFEFPYRSVRINCIKMLQLNGWAGFFLCQFSSVFVVVFYFSF